MPRKKRSGGIPKKRPIDRYEHSDKKRINNPPVGLVTPETDPVAPTHKTYDYITPVPSVKSRQELDYDPHLDPQLRRKYTDEVPVVFIGGRKSFKYHMGMDDFLRVLASRG